MAVWQINGDDIFLKIGWDEVVMARVDDMVVDVYILINMIMSNQILESRENAMFSHKQGRR